MHNIQDTHDKTRQSSSDGTGRTVQGILDKIEQERSEYLETEKQGRKWTEMDRTRLNRTGLRPTTTNLKPDTNPGKTTQTSKTELNKQNKQKKTTLD